LKALSPLTHTSSSKITQRGTSRKDLNTANSKTRIGGGAASDDDDDDLDVDDGEYYSDEREY
jgi:phosphopantothenoylcysteine synthetase/decarboxylase